MQELSSVRQKRTDQKLNILILQTVTIAVILLFAVGIRLFGGDIYTKISGWYHEKFDEITRSSEVLEPQNNVSNDEMSEDTTFEIPHDMPSETEDSEDIGDGEEYDPEIDGALSGNILDYDTVESTTAAASVNTLRWPVSGTVSSKYGHRVHPITGKYTMHNGLDIAAASGTEISAAYDGVVASAGYSDSYGYYLIVSHSGGLQTLYAHCSKLKAEKGDIVKKGDVIGLVGSTGISTGPHLHFEVRVSNYRIDPEWLLSELLDV